MPGLLLCEQRKPSQGEAVGQMPGSEAWPGRQYSADWPDISPVVVAFLRKRTFLVTHPEWTIDYDRETDSYVATEREQPNSTTFVVEKSMSVLIRNLEARCNEKANREQS